MPKVSIIVLCHDRWDGTRRCLEALRRATDARDYELLVYDNASSDGTAAGLRRMARGWPQLRVLRNERNVPFAEAVNRGMRAARGEHFLWLNDDTAPTPGWLDELLAAAASAGDVGAVGPMTDHLAPPLQLRRAASPSRGLEEVPFLGGFCFLLKREAAERAGSLDERFVWGWEDIDYCLRLRRMGLRLVVARGAFVHHAGSRTIRIQPPLERRLQDLGNRNLIMRKWREEPDLGADLAGLLEDSPAPWLPRRPAPVSIIMLCRNRWADAKRCLESLRRSTDPLSYELLVYDNASSDGTAAGLRRMARGWPQLRVFTNERNVPFAEAVNRGMRAAQGGHFLWLNNDTILSPGWLDGLLRAAAADDVGAAGPMTDHLSPPLQLSRPFRNRSARVEETPFLGGFCFLLKRQAAERVGLLDERYVWGLEDMDYSLRLRQAGYRLALARGVFVHHIGNRTISTMAPSERRESDLANRELIARKWLHAPPWRKDLATLLEQCPAPWQKPPAPLVTVIVVCRGEWEASRKGLESVRRSLGDLPCEVVAAALDAGRRTAVGLTALAREWPALRFLGDWTRVPYSHAVNLALRAANGDNLVILGDGVRVPRGWLDGLLSRVKGNPIAGVVSPEGKSRDLCLLVSRTALASLGDFDDRFMDGGGFEDYRYRAEQRGYHVLAAPAVSLRPARGSGPSPHRSRDLRLLFDKWGLPGMKKR